MSGLGCSFPDRPRLSLDLNTSNEGLPPLPFHFRAVLTVRKGFIELKSAPPPAAPAHRFQAPPWSHARDAGGLSRRDLLQIQTQTSCLQSMSSWHAHLFHPIVPSTGVHWRPLLSLRCPLIHRAAPRGSRVPDLDATLFSWCCVGRALGVLSGPEGSAEP